ncbi:shikimate dehydrogenase [Pseudocolwellia agarivorans]|uniref:shikimate dehydrogenase n=1 Tax=Pseudocolwellia agarivorans TaxID=1911682 RepID=UPI000986740B|nr:shikimate dehydrogenase [Pseudocolwellia agarivorans]
MDHYLVYGNPIKQSKSPFIHTAFAKETNQNIEYKSQLAELGEFEQTVKLFIKEGGKGANVTAPFKEEAMAMCDELSEHAQFSGAVNTLTFKNDKIYGDTTDGVGLVNDLLSHNVELENSRILLLGAGGASKGVVLPLLNQKPKHLTIANRTVSKAETIAQQYANQPITAMSFEDANKQEFDLIINATSAGLSGNGVPISETLISNNTACYDMTYGKSLTPFLQMATKQNAKQIIDGLGMLVGQAAESFYLWRGVRPETSKVLNELRKELSQ